MAALDFTETRFTPAFRDIIRDPAVVEEFDRLSVFLRTALAGLAQSVVEVQLEDGPPKYFDPTGNGGLGSLTTTAPATAVQNSDGVTPIPNSYHTSHHSSYITQVIQRYHTIFQRGTSNPDGDVGDGAGGGGGDIQIATVDLTDSQIKSLNTSPVQIVAAPGTDKAIAVIQAIAQINFPTTAYSANPTSSLQYASTVSASDFTLRLGTTGERFYRGAPSALDITTISQVENQKLELATSANVTGGAVTNKLRIVVLYRIMDFP